MERTYSDSELEDMKPDHHKFKFEGKEFDTYTASQMQRRLEREIRKQERLRKSYKAAGLDEEYKNTRARLQVLHKKYTDFSKAAGLPEQRERMRVLYT